MFDGGQSSVKVPIDIGSHAAVPGTVLPLSPLALLIRRQRHGETFWAFLTLYSAAVWGPPHAVCVAGRRPSVCCACRDHVSAAEEDFEVTVRKPLGITLVEGAEGFVVVEEVRNKCIASSVLPAPA